MNWHKVKIRKTDKRFSWYIRERDGWTCQLCGHYLGEGARNLHCSHHFTRRYESTRFDPENCDALCTSCHRRIESPEGHEEYKQFKVDQLGQKGFDLLEHRAKNEVKKRDDEMDLLYIEELIKDL